MLTLERVGAVSVTPPRAFAWWTGINARIAKREKRTRDDLRFKVYCWLIMGDS